MTCPDGGRVDSASSKAACPDDAEVNMMNKKISAGLEAGWLDFLKELLAIDSRTADGWQGAEQVSRKLGDVLESLGFTLQWHEPLGDPQPRGRHLVAVRNADAPRRIMFVGHSDVVLDPALMPVRVDEARGRLLGSGAWDMKGGDVLMLRAIEYAIGQSQAARDMGMVVLINSAEEAGSVSFPLLQKQWVDQTVACLCFEPARFGEHGGASDETAAQFFVSGRKGVAKYELTCRGRAGHAGNAHRAGVNALRELARKTEQIEALTDETRHLTANVGVFHSGLVVNQIPDEAVIKFELRAFDPQVLAQACATAEALATQSTVRSAVDGATTSLEFTKMLPYPAWHPSAADAELAQRYMKHLASHGLAMTPVQSAGGSDASIMAAYMPTIDGLGPLGANGHRLDEWIDLTSFEARARAAGDLVIDLSQS